MAARRIATLGAGMVGVTGAALGLLRVLPDPDPSPPSGSHHHHTSASKEFDLERVRQELAQRAQVGVAPFDTQWLNGELSSDHAGETGAVWIYRGALDAMKVNRRSAEVARGFALEHMQAEQRHLDLIEAVVPNEGRTLLVPAWQVSGWVLGALPTLVGPAALFVTVQAVETFVEKHYMQQITPLATEGSCPELVRLLRACCEDEVHHRDDAEARAQAAGVTPGLAVSLWQAVVEGGSAVAAEVARRI